ncbi:hypothetical protein Tco_0475377 [Tanacetum coccineum]
MLSSLPINSYISTDKKVVLFSIEVNSVSKLRQSSIKLKSGKQHPNKREIAPAKTPQIITHKYTFNIKQKPRIHQKEDLCTWAMEMEHYLEYIDNEVWKVIQNGNSKKRVTKGKDGVYRVLPPTTQAEQVADEKERKARTLLLMAVPKDHLRRFSGMRMNAKESQRGPLSRHGVCESLEKGYDRFQKLLSQLDALGASVSDEDEKHKFLRSLPPAWDNIQKTSSSSLTSDNATPTSTPPGLADEVIHILSNQTNADDWI